MTAPRTLALLLMAPLACSPGQRPTPEAGHSSAIIGGTTERGYAAVGALLEDGYPVCTGTLVSSTVVVTAAHCIAGVSASEMSFFVGPDTDTTGTSLAAESLNPHPDYDDDELTSDVGVVVLSEALDVEVIPWLVGEMTDDWVGQQALAVGYGLSEDTYGEKRSATIEIEEVWDDAFYYDGVTTNTCEGDSGGPALVSIDDQTTLIGVTSYGDPDCEEYGVNARVDVFDSFISGFVEETAETGGSEETGGSGETGGSEEAGEGTVHGLAEGSLEARAVLTVANTASQDVLDHDVPLDSRAAENIVEARPFDTLAELDAVSYVATTAFAALMTYAEATGVLDALQWVHGVEEGSEEGQAILLLVNHLSQDALDDDVPLDSRAAEAIVAARPIDTLTDLDAVSYVGASAFGALQSYAESIGMLETSDWCEDEGWYSDGICDADCPQPDPDCE